MGLPSPTLLNCQISPWLLCNVFLFLGGSFLVFLFNTSWYSTSIFNIASVAGDDFSVKIDPPDPTFYDYPNLSYSIEKRMENCDQKRKSWLDLHPRFSAGAGERILLVTGSQPSACKNPIGDHLLLRLFNNKVDYCRIHGHEIFYNNAYLQPQMGSLLSQTSNNPGRNVGPSRSGMDLVDGLGRCVHGHGIQSPIREIQRLQPRGPRRKWGDKVYLEWEYYLESHWIGVVGSYDNITRGYREMEKREVGLRRRHAERVSRFYEGLREPEIEKAEFRSGASRRPFVSRV
ncbi:unnamed protein product [Citrullus colocynthis]|uniref:Uncharacterized protein n=1 Tax=Citrullus colocynthis TaxID=252529 RepID=A0ABP0YJ93_9ROSI